MAAAGNEQAEFWFRVMQGQHHCKDSILGKTCKRVIYK